MLHLTKELRAVSSAEIAILQITSLGLSLMYSRKVLDQERSLEELYHKLDTVVKTSHPEPPETVCY